MVSLVSFPSFCLFFPYTMGLSRGTLPGTPSKSGVLLNKKRKSRYRAKKNQKFYFSKSSES